MRDINEILNELAEISGLLHAGLRSTGLTHALWNRQEYVREEAKQAINADFNVLARVLTLAIGSAPAPVIEGVR